MKTTIHRIPTLSLEDFADQHHLEMVVRERKNPSTPSMRFFASFADVEVKEGHAMISALGNGATIEQAIANYIPRISGKTIVANTMRDGQNEIEVPYLKAKS